MIFSPETLLGNTALSAADRPAETEAARVWVAPVGVADGDPAGGSLADGGLVGRGAELEHLESELSQVRSGNSRTVVLVGEAGIGKTALLELVQARAGEKFLRVSGVESELELAFAGLYQLCAPLLGDLGRLPTAMRDALRTTFGLREGPPPDPLLVALAVLHLLAEREDTEPLTCVIDDAQWLDRTSLQTLAFVARRLRAESVLMVFATRNPCDELAGLPTRRLTGLSDSDAHALLARAVPGCLDRQVQARIVAEARGNPLALLELPRGLAPAEVSAGFTAASAEYSPSPVEESFARRIRSLPTTTRLLLIVAAAEPAGDMALVWRAAEHLGIPFDAADPAIAAGLAELGIQTGFRHPLVRSAAYRSASSADRRAAHQALANVTDAGTDADRQAWHQAQAAAGPDEEVAEGLERRAGRARARGGLAAAAAFLERAAALTPDPAARATRALAAAQVMHEAGAPAHARRLLAAAQSGAPDDLQSARCDLLLGRIAYATNHGGDAPPLLLRAAERLEHLDVGLARSTYLEALSAAQFAGPCTPAGVRATAEAASRAPRPLTSGLGSDLLLDGLAALHGRGFAAGLPQLRQALDRFARGDVTEEESLRWAWLACRTAIDLWDYDAWSALADAITRSIREAGALSALPMALTLQITARVYAGDLDSVTRLSDELSSLVETTGIHITQYGLLHMSAWRGHEADAKMAIAAAMSEAAARGEGQGVTAAFMARAILGNGLGRFDDAYVAAERGSQFPDDLAFYHQSLVELVEAAERTGRRERALESLERLAERARPAETPWSLGVHARCKGLVCDGPGAEDLFREAVYHLEGSAVRVELARTHLVFGEWLRRERRLGQAREQLRAAHDLFTRMGVEAFGARAATELRAAGEQPRRGSVVVPVTLTSQELRVARIVAAGATTKEVATELFLSPRTVDAHLRSIFGKLNITSRRQLRAVPGLASRRDPVGAP